MVEGEGRSEGQSIKCAAKRLLKFRVAKTAKAAILGKKVNFSSHFAPGRGRRFLRRFLSSQFSKTSGSR
jgi:hypothetical protein